IALGTGIHGHGPTKIDRRNARDRLNIVENRLVQTEQPFGIFDHCRRKMNVERFDFGWRRESWLNVYQGLEGTDHEARAHEQNKSQTYLDDYKRATRPKSLPAGADRTTRFAQSSATPGGRCAERQHRAEQKTCDHGDA